MAEPKIWMNGKLVTQAEAVLPVNSAAVFYATNVFEGLRAYWNETDDELYCFRLDEHFARLPRVDEDDALHGAVQRRRPARRGRERRSPATTFREDIHMHLVAYVAGAGLDATSPTGLYINPRRRGRIAEGSGLRCCISSWARTCDNAIPIRLKCGANYQNGRLAMLQAKADGYDAPIFLNQLGPGRRGHGRDVLHDPQGPDRHAAGDRRHPREHHAHHPHREDLPRGLRHAGRRARDRPHGAVRGRGGVLLRQRLRDHADHLRSTASRSATATSGPSRRSSRRRT